MSVDEPIAIASIVWRLDGDQSSEHAWVSERADGATLAGRTVLVVHRRPASIAYEVELDHRWHTRTVSAAVRFGTSPEWRVEVVMHDGRWSFDGVPDDTFDGCIDVDLGWTPATNLLPIRRCDLQVGESVEIDTAWLRFPELEFARGNQRYTRLDETTWRYESGDFARDLTVNRRDFVTAYGDDLWQAVATSG